MKLLTIAGRLTAAFGVLASSIGLADTREPASLTIATWNLEWLNSRSDKGVVKRTEADYQRLRGYARKLGADIVAFQEVDGAAAARRVFDPAVYAIHITSSRNVQRVGFAYKKTLRVTPHADLRSLGAKGLRRGADMTVDVGGKKLRLLNVHMKSGCWGGDLGRGTKACRKLRAQVPHLEAWIDARAAAGTPFMVLGDFNRRLAPGEQLWQEIDDGHPLNADLTSVVEGRRSRCWGGRYPEYIDHIVLDRLASLWVKSSSVRQMLFAPGDERYRHQLSDHCPLSVVVAPPRSRAEASQ